MKERPIIFSGEMVQAILAGRKTQTRRIIKHISVEIDCPYGEPGEILWVREAWSSHPIPNKIKPSNLPHDWPFVYRADIPRDDSRQSSFVWRPSRHMPRWASRITLEITRVRKERLHEISHKDACAEGAPIAPVLNAICLGCYAELWFSARWDHLNAKRGFGWDTNPWV